MRFFLLLVVLTACSAGTVLAHSNPGISSKYSRRNLPCNLPMRIVVPALFSHCGASCAYSNWSSWEIIQKNIPISPNQCSSKSYFVEQRTREVLAVVGNINECNNLTQARNVCHPSNAELLIMDLNLGGSGHNLGENSVIKVTNKVGLSWWGTRPQTTYTIVPPGPRGSGQLCPHVNQFDSNVCQSSTGKKKRSEDSEDDSLIKNKHLVKHTTLKMSENSNIKVLPFDWNMHRHYFRHRRETGCDTADIHHVLFVLDSSGSIGESNFIDMKKQIATLVPMFCNKIKVALVTFSSEIKLEFCFDCYTNILLGRKSAADAINSTEYLGRMTYSGAAVKCICNKILDQSCGISSTPECLKVIFITDGKSNDQNLNVCEEIKCLHKHKGINVLAIGIDGYNQDELECIGDSTDSLQTLKYKSFQSFKESIAEVRDLVTKGTIKAYQEANGQPETLPCSTHAGKLSEH